jgi:HSP20 family protein
MTEKATETTGQPGGRTAARWDLSEMLETLQGEMARLWAQTWPLGPWAMSRPLRRMVPTPAAWAPRVDVFEKDSHLVVKAELPGVKREDVEITLEQGDLVIKGERKAEAGVREEDYHRLERSQGIFYRHLALPFEAKPEDITAHFAHGVLELAIPRPAVAAHAATKIPVA